jgi:hypothetical protein
MTYWPPSYSPQQKILRKQQKAYTLHIQIISSDHQILTNTKNNKHFKKKNLIPKISQSLIQFQSWLVPVLGGFLLLQRPIGGLSGTYRGGVFRVI